MILQYQSVEMHTASTLIAYVHNIVYANNQHIRDRARNLVNHNASSDNNRQEPTPPMYTPTTLNLHGNIIAPQLPSTDKTGNSKSDDKGEDTDLTPIAYAKKDNNGPVTDKENTSTRLLPDSRNSGYAKTSA
jgi:hypothetical protein